MRSFNQAKICLHWKSFLLTAVVKLSNTVCSERSCVYGGLFLFVDCQSQIALLLCSTMSCVQHCFDWWSEGISNGVKRLFSFQIIEWIVLVWVISASFGLVKKLYWNIRCFFFVFLEMEKRIGQCLETTKPPSMAHSKCALRMQWYCWMHMW